MTYMNNDADFAVSGGIQELNMGEVEQVGGALTAEDVYMLGYFLSVSAGTFVTNPAAGLKSFYYDGKWFVSKF